MLTADERVGLEPEDIELLEQPLGPTPDELLETSARIEAGNRRIEAQVNLLAIGLVIFFGVLLWRWW